VFATLMTRYQVQVKAAVATHITAGRPEVAQRLAALSQYLIAKGLDFESARLAAQRILGGIVAKQAMVMTFEKLFLVSGIAFLCVMPLLYFLKAPRTNTPSPKVDVHVEI
jgi:DHA2 family multidrug resistance protein